MFTLLQTATGATTFFVVVAYNMVIDTTASKQNVSKAVVNNLFHWKRHYQNMYKFIGTVGHNDGKITSDFIVNNYSIRYGKKIERNEMKSMACVSLAFSQLSSTHCSTLLSFAPEQKSSSKAIDTICIPWLAGLVDNNRTIDFTTFQLFLFLFGQPPAREWLAFRLESNR